MNELRPNPTGEADSSQPGSRIGGCFQVETLLGRGGAAVVYRVRDERDDRRLALKQLVRAAGSRADVLTSQFEREFYTLCQLAHPRIVTVYDYGLDHGTPFYTMELLDGEDLSARRKLPWRDVCALLRDVASSLAIIHSRRLVHRDLSLRNVRCTSDGRAKLIDFGALAAMGTVKQVIGTPPFVSPEALQLQALDGRTDLYALGVLAYFMLTGYYPYHARSVAQLRSLWRSPPYGPARYHHGLPATLDSLVMGLLELDRAQRPGSAAEVMERLSGIAGLPLDELPEVRKAYLATPMLVGRQTLLDRVRAALTQTQQGRGGCLLIEGPAGIGRSRVLDACVLDAKIQGSLLLRGDATDSGDQYGLVQVLCAQLIQHAPELCEQAVGARRALLGRVVAEFAEGAEVLELVPDRPQLQSALCDFISAVARAKPLVIAVDDVDKIDEASAAVLSGLADRAKAIGICLLLTVETASAPSPAIALLRSLATPLTLEALNASQTEALLRSVFGDVAHVAGLSERVQRVTEGNPLWTMTVAEQLVEHGVARYEAGSWSLPVELEPGVLPQYLAGALWRRLAALTFDARELGEALALTDPALLSVSEYRLLTTHGDPGRVYEALDTLVASRILIAEGKRYRFGQPGLPELLREGQDPARARAHHARITRALEGGRHPLQLAYHRMLAGQEREALELLLLLVGGRRGATAASFEAELAERAVHTAERLQLPLREQLVFRQWLVAATAMIGLPQAARHGVLLVQQYERDSGLCDYRLLGADVAPAQRAAIAIEHARRRHAATDANERGLAPEEAMLELATVCAYLVAFAAIAHDLALLEGLPSLLPLCEVSPALAIARLHIESQVGLLSGCFEGVTERCHEIIRRLDQPERSGLPAEHAPGMRFGMIYVLGLFAAAGAQPRTREWVGELQRAPGYRANAWRVRMVYELMQGNQDAAAVCQRRAELLQLQESGQSVLPGTTVKIELFAAIHAGDLMAVKRARARLEGLAARHPNWKWTLCLADSHYRRLQGDMEGALHALAPALEVARPGRHADWDELVAAEVSALSALGRAEEACERGLQYLDRSVAARHWAAHHDLLRSVAQAAQHAQRFDQALALMKRCLDWQEREGPRGIVLALAYEARASLAIAMNDQDALQRYFELCAQQFANPHDGMLTRKYEQLKAQAQDAGLELAPPARSPLLAAAGKPRAPRVAALLVEPV